MRPKLPPKHFIFTKFLEKIDKREEFFYGDILNQNIL